jgi:hypothetical protein
MASDVLEWTPRRPGTRPLAPRRDIKLQICVSAQERAQLERQARASGYESVAAYVRARTVSAPNGAA